MFFVNTEIRDYAFFIKKYGLSNAMLKDIYIKSNLKLEFLFSGVDKITSSKIQFWE